MSVYEGRCDWAARKAWRQARPGAWRPLELAAMIAGFAIWWPIGLAVLFAKLWQKRERFSGDLFSFAKERAMAGMPAGFASGFAARDAWTSNWGGGLGMRGTGNAAFDEWRAGELERLEAERRKLADAEREFAEHLANLRKARDREEFDRFMHERNARQNGPTSV